MIIIGASGHGKVIADILESNYVREIIFWDDNPNAAIENYTVAPRQPNSSEKVIVGIGNNTIRKRIVDSYNYEYIFAYHSRSMLHHDVPLGEGSVIMAGAIINIGTEIGRHSIINTGSIIDHDGRIGDFVHISPGAVLAGNVTVNEGAWVGAGATVIQGISIGKWATVGAGAVVIRNIPDYAVAVGNPARIIKYNQPEF